MRNISFSPLGDCAIMMDFGKEINLKTNKNIIDIYQSIKSRPFQGFIESVPAYTTLTVYYDPVSVGTEFPYETVKNELEQCAKNLSAIIHTNNKIVTIPVCYEEPYAMDLDFVATYSGLTKNEIINIHSETTYHIYFLGFAPGFPFLGGMSEKITAPRRTNPRLKVPKGAVGIAGQQTGVYPFESPGGWQVIGRTPLELFNSNTMPPSLLLPGDKVRFTEISKEDFDLLEGKQ
ncbi:5-oxoprolinase subunit PxpB [Bacillus sp. FJAT-49711]|uniref:5-oxoprolinase subunit PxpB n=1 Tax=Bacillus sp. FJAT-49711 TaxID=2833585 RepID=UPI001BC8CF9A|nr:5-oxoprolinase subunit PxpB [Bacillus sp. FJAT-49711]MBS4219752.1 5-oxoprolinase subunit PxpB [Bacillus sp. FJAT-49711]